MSHNWTETREKLIAGSIPAFQSFFAIHPLESIRAIGYTWEWGQPHAAFYLVANTQNGIDSALLDINKYRPNDSLGPVKALEEIRWNAGYFPFPAGLTGPDGEMGAAWEAEAKTLHAMIEAMRPADNKNEEQYARYVRNWDALMAPLEKTCCEALAEIALQGHFGDFSQIDFYVGSTDENGDIVRDRNTLIRQMIADKR